MEKSLIEKTKQNKTKKMKNLGSERKDKKWFIAILILNTVGILEILYIYIFSEIKFNERKSRKKQRR